MTAENKQPANWQEEDSHLFQEWGSLFTPRQWEMKATILNLLPKKKEEPFHVVEIGCGSGWLSEAILEKFSQVNITALDGSPAMLSTTKERLKPFEDRVAYQLFRLEEDAWLASLQQKVDVFVSSLVIHHLDDEEKKQFFQQLYDALLPGGALVIADLVKPHHQQIENHWAEEWDHVVKEQSKDAYGDLRGFDAFVKEEWNLYRYPDELLDKPSLLSDQLKWLEQAGFQGVDVSWLKAGHAIFSGYKKK
ncbi:class I SAM-dependent methyltransferase [Marininema halotolerans]|uniref:tRNA (Cmo5U34)-methyltransferase n=1 Tax=Marininema halotolerans TaxID=1155944 RepID=A0A1I6R7J1_9BACL|nr:class I SAM-dependent methyltransferase [Marininema halotolerans]SFS60669.1 tRNA (cmo5U34)-methyltransferase [Marininema halotolerans]